LVVYTKPIGN